jgi:ABC-2 type transport system ATP-binding protein
MIEVTNLTKAYGLIEALRGVSFNVASGEIVGLLGPNGAGKSTAMKILTGYLQPDGGEVKVDGLNVLTHTREVQARIGYLPENAPLYPDLSVQAYLLLMADMREIPREQQMASISRAVYATSLADHLTRPIGQLSKGYRQRVGLAQAILHQPKLLIFDEPTVGLDPTQIVEIRRLIRRLAPQSTILFSSHILSEVEAVCDRVIIIMNGEVKADARLSDLAATGNAVLVLQEPVSGVEKSLQSLPGVTQVEPVADHYPAYRVYSSDEVNLCPAIYTLARQENWPVRELRRDVRTLEAVFNELATTTTTSEEA